MVGRFLPKSQALIRSFTAGLRFDFRQYNEALTIRERFISKLEQFLDLWDVWLCPVTPGVAFLHQRPSKFGKPPAIMIDDHRLSYLEGTISMTVPFSLTGSPVTTLPVGVVNGLPVGVQLVGQRWCDEALLDNCLAIEVVTGGFQPPPGYSITL
jgi:amidase